MRSLILAVAATTVLATPAMAQEANGHAYGLGPKVCLVSFASAADLLSGADALVTKAQYLPLPIAQKLEARNPYSATWTYGSTGYAGPGVDHPNVGDPTLTTEEVCNYLAGLAESGSDD